MNRIARTLLGGVATATLFAACSSSDIASPTAARLSGGSNAGGSGGKVSCTNTLTLSAAATEALTGNAFSASYVLVSCQSKNRVSMTATDLSTGQVVWQSVPDLAGTIALWTLPYKLTSYRIDATVISGSTGTVVATGSTVVATMDALPCDPFVHESATVGYWGIYPAIWAASDAQDCGRGGSVHLRITNMNSGRTELDYPGLGLSNMIDFEGAIVSYNTPYRVYAELRSSSGELLASSTTDVMSSVFR